MPIRSPRSKARARAKHIRSLKPQTSEERTAERDRITQERIRKEDAMRYLLFSTLPGSKLIPTLLSEGRKKDAAKKKRGEVKKMLGGRVTRSIDGRATKGLTRGSGRT